MAAPIENILCCSRKRGLRAPFLLSVSKEGFSSSHLRGRVQQSLPHAYSEAENIHLIGDAIVLPCLHPPTHHPSFRLSSCHSLLLHVCNSPPTASLVLPAAHTQTHCRQRKACKSMKKGKPDNTRCNPLGELKRGPVWQLGVRRLLKSSSSRKQSGLWSLTSRLAEADGNSSGACRPTRPALSQTEKPFGTYMCRRVYTYCTTDAW